MELLDACNKCEDIIRGRRGDLITHLSHVLDNDREFGLTIGRMETLKQYKRRILAIRKEYEELIKEVEQIAKQADQV